MKLASLRKSQNLIQKTKPHISCFSKQAYIQLLLAQQLMLLTSISGNWFLCVQKMFGCIPWTFQWLYTAPQLLYGFKLVMSSDLWYMKGTSAYLALIMTEACECSLFSCLCSISAIAKLLNFDCKFVTFDLYKIESIFISMYELNVYVQTYITTIYVDVLFAPKMFTQCNYIRMLMQLGYTLFMAL